MSQKDSVRLLRPGDYRRMPWKNGGGTTAEIEVFPESASAADESFLWRLSSAEVSQDGPFSVFADYSRFLTLIDGSGLKLKFLENGKEESLSIGRVLQFRGDARIEARLLDGPVSDLNLIYRRDGVQASFRVIELGKKPRSFEPQGRVAFFVGIQGAVDASVFPGEKKFRIKKGETLRVEGSGKMILLEPFAEACRIAAIDLRWGGF